MRGQPIDAFLALLVIQAGFSQQSLRFGRCEAFVLKDAGAVNESSHPQMEVADLARLLALGTVAMNRQPHDDAADVLALDQLAQELFVHSLIAAVISIERRDPTLAFITHGQADTNCAIIDAQQSAALGQFFRDG